MKVLKENRVYSFDEIFKIANAMLLQEMLLDNTGYSIVYKKAPDDVYYLANDPEKDPGYQSVFGSKKEAISSRMYKFLKRKGYSIKIVHASRAFDYEGRKDAEVATDPYITKE